MKYGFIRENASLYPVNMMCRLLRVHRSDYYYWYRQPCRIIPPAELALQRRMKALFAASRDSLGSRTLIENLCAEEFSIGRERTRNLMKALKHRIKYGEQTSPTYGRRKVGFIWPL